MNKEFAREPLFFQIYLFSTLLCSPTAFRAALPDLNLTIEDMVGQWNKVAIRFTIQGTHKGEPLGSAPTGQRVILSGMMIHAITDEKITDTWSSHDLVSAIQQSEPVPTAV